jgi:hypothetical protein
MQAPPLLPEETFARVCRVARFDGMSILVVAGVFALISALAGDFVGAVIGLLVAGAGAMELHGVTLLHHCEPRGMDWLWGSQCFLLLTVLGYCAFQFARAKLPALPAEVETLIRQDADQLGITTEEFLRMFNRMLYGGVAVATFVYQGGMAFYYLRRRTAVRRALESEL